MVVSLALIGAVAGGPTACAQRPTTPAQTSPRPVVSPTSAATSTTRPVPPSTAGAVPGSPPGKTGAATDVVVLDPFRRDGTLLPGWTVHNGPQSPPADCRFDTGSPAARSGGTHACGSTAAGAVACWAPRADGHLVCAADAWDRRLFRIPAANLRPVTHAPARPVPLGLELVDGTRWSLRTGGAWGGRADGLTGAYGCVSSCAALHGGSGPGTTTWVLLAPSGASAVDMDAPTWTVRRGLVGNPDVRYPAPTPVPVRRAWFIASTLS
ncbi:hypothetical protein GCM10009657_02700 [Oryzihumus leptocrescens]